MLGVINTWRQMRRDKVRLKVVPKHVIPVGVIERAQLNFGLEVINMSEFPVVIEDVGLLLVDGRHGTLATVPGMESNGKLPLRLELVAPIRDRQHASETESRTLAALRDTLLPKLISGDLRVPDAERIVGRCL
ncbi:MAG: hypothetical protein QM278_06195 [Pseudomonadota bacterium]|nr:hypothetical protein [Pseudomonadota bacterium]